jgi:hypothetical protein
MYTFPVRLNTFRYYLCFLLTDRKMSDVRAALAALSATRRAADERDRGAEGSGAPCPSHSPAVMTNVVSFGGTSGSFLELPKQTENPVLVQCLQEASGSKKE